MSTQTRDQADGLARVRAWSAAMHALDTGQIGTGEYQVARAVALSLEGGVCTRTTAELAAAAGVSYAELPEILQQLERVGLFRLDHGHTFQPGPALRWTKFCRPCGELVADQGEEGGAA